VKGFLFGSEAIASPLANLGLFLLRVYAGLSLALAHGIHKFPPSARFIDGVADLGFPAPTLFAWLASCSELIGGILLAIGLFTRPSALMIGITVAVAGFLRHADDPFGSKEKAFLFLAISLLFLLIGGGKYALDRAFKK
jgi:putative oxidoreductase